MTSPQVEADIKLRAISELLNRGWGRAAQSVEHTGKDGADEIRVTLRTIIEGKK